MRLLEAILDANQRLGADRKAPLLDTAQFGDALPLAALTCIDARLNKLIPEVLGVPEEQFIWLRNAGNIIFGHTSAMMRSLALACAIKGGREIAVIGHTDCLVCKSTVLALTDKLKALGVERAKLPNDLVEFFGLFASERQNVMKACETIRTSPLIGSRVPVHGLMVDITTGKLEWIVNGYTTTAAGSEVHLHAGLGGKELVDMKFDLPQFQIGEMKFPEVKIGGVELKLETKPEQIGSVVAKPAETKPAETAPVEWKPSDTKRAEERQPALSLHTAINKALKYRIIGTDGKQYGPVSGSKLLEWLADDRIGGETPVQVEGGKLWQKLNQLASAASRKDKPPPLK